MHNPTADPSSHSIHHSMGSARWWLGLGGMVSVLWACGAATESLWVDELHTSWTVAGGWSEVAPRARAGNQSPLFFWLLYGLMGTLGNFTAIPQEWLLRLPAIVCFGGVVYLCLREALMEGSGKVGVVAVLAAIFAWLLLDRVQLFYASEARVYSTVQLVSLLAWLAVWRLRQGKQYVWLWCGLSVMLVFLHVTALLAVVCQIAWGTLLVCRLDRDQCLRWSRGVGVVVMAMVSALLLSARVWEHRAQWNSFAGEATFASFLGLLPLLAYSVPVGLARSLDGLCQLWERNRRAGTPADRTSRTDHGGKRPARQQFKADTSCVRAINPRPWRVAVWDAVLSFRGLWWVATLGPWLAAWCITALELAPVFHRRFVIVAAVPLVMLAAVELGRVRSKTFCWLAVLGVAAWLSISQGTLDNWRAGNWFGWQRWEGWRQATVALDAQMQSGDQLWCASGLVEATAASPPVDDQLDRYLSFPLRGIYRVSDASGKPIEPHGLLDSGADWATQLLADQPATPGWDISPATSLSSEQTLWIVYRGSAQGFKQRLEAMRKRLVAQANVECRSDLLQAFGRVNIVRLRIVVPK